jgi:hypothetical protein
VGKAARGKSKEGEAPSVQGGEAGGHNPGGQESIEPRPPQLIIGHLNVEVSAMRLPVA